jgi:nicotinamidase-related amidase
MGAVAVLTNDLQADLVISRPERAEVVARATPRFVSFLNQMRERGHHVVHLQLILLEGDPHLELVDGHPQAQRGTEGAAILPEFLAETDLVVEKNKDSGFYETSLHEDLRRLNVDTLIVTGMQTQICVQTTAADAFFRGYNVWVASDCVVSTKEVDKLRALQWLSGYCATVADSSEILSTLDEKGELPRFVPPVP